MEDLEIFDESTKANRPADRDTGDKGTPAPEVPENQKKTNKSDPHRPADIKDTSTKTFGESVKEEFDTIVFEKESFALDDELNDLFESEDEISDEFKSKFSTVFEASVNAAARKHVTALREAIESKAGEVDQRFDEAVEEHKAKLDEKIDTYVDSAVQEYMEENKLAIERGIHEERADNLLAGLRDLLAEHYVTIDEDKADLYKEQQAKIEELTSKLDEQMEENLSMKEDAKKAKKAQVIESMTARLSDAKAERLRDLAEDVTFRDEESFRNSIKTLQESNFGNKLNSSNVDSLTEEDMSDGGHRIEESIDDPSFDAVRKMLVG